MRRARPKHPGPTLMQPILALSLVCALTASCAGPSLTSSLWDPATERESVSAMLDAHDSFVLENRMVEATTYFYQPPVWVDTGWPHAANDLDEVSAIFEDQKRWLEARGLVSQQPLERSIHILSPSAAVATQTFAQWDEQGKPLNPQSSAVTYLLVKINAEWRISAVLRHHPDRALQ